MNCQFCTETLSGLVAGLVALITFLVIPIAQILLALFKIIINKIVSL